jgi:hypothetical protein
MPDGSEFEATRGKMNSPRLLFAAFIGCIALPMASGAVARELTSDDYTCIIFPPACPKVSKSTSQELVRISLYRGHLGKRDRNAPREVVPLAVPRAFIVWLPYLKPEPQASVAFEAAIPDFENPALIPASVWKASRHDELAARGGPPAPHDLHAHWVHIELSLSPSLEGIDCATASCPPTITERIATMRDEEFIHPAEPGNDGRQVFHPRARTTPYYQFENKQLVVVRSGTVPAEVLIICDRDPAMPFNWCEVDTTLGRGTRLSYHFEARYLEHFLGIDSTVRAFVEEALGRAVLEQAAGNGG